MTQKQQFLETFRQRHPDCDCDNEEALFGILTADCRDDARCIADYRRREADMADLIYADPRSAAFLNSWRQGADPVVELVRSFGPEIREALDDPELQERLAEANRDYLERLASEQELNREFESNIAASAEMVDAVAAREGIPDDRLMAAWEWLRRVTDQGIRGIVSEDALLMALQAITHEQDVAVAAREGELRGRNAAIDEHLRQLDGATDGTVARSGAGKPGRKLPPLGVIDSYAGYRSVWE